MRASTSERRALWYAPAVTVGRLARSNYSVAEDDAQSAEDARHGDRMERVDAAVDDLPARHRAAVYQVHGLGSLQAEMLDGEALQAAYREALSALVPLLQRRGLM